MKCAITPCTGTARLRKLTAPTGQDFNVVICPQHEHEFWGNSGPFAGFGYDKRTEWLKKAAVAFEDHAASYYLLHQRGAWRLFAALDDGRLLAVSTGVFLADETHARALLAAGNLDEEWHVAPMGERMVFEEARDDGRLIQIVICAPSP